MPRLLAAAALAAVLALGRAAEAAEPGVEEFRLENGLTVLLRPIAGAEDVALVTLFSIGEESDPPDACGTAHLLEHLYVTAAAGQAPARTAEQMMVRYPKGSNAQTGWDYTVVATVFPKAELARELEDAAARMGDLRIEASDLEREVPRVLRELENMYRRMPALAPMNHAANAAWERADRPHGGDPASVQKIPLEALRARWASFYKPVNAMVVLAGGLDADSRAAVTKAFAAVKTGDPVPLPRGPVRLKSEPEASPAWATEIRKVPSPDLIGDRTYVAISVPLPRLARSPAWLVVAARLLVPGGLPRRLGTRVQFTPIDRPESLTLFADVPKETTPESRVASLERDLAAAAAPPLTAVDIDRVRQGFGFLLGLTAAPDAALRANPYGVAFGLGRRRQMGIDPPVLGAALDALKDADLKALDLRAARVVVGPKP